MLFFCEKILDGWCRVLHHFTAKWFKGTEKKPQIPIIAEDFAIATESSAK